jgi:hypothetical protein
MMKVVINDIIENVLLELILIEQTTPKAIYNNLFSVVCYGVLWESKLIQYF